MALLNLEGRDSSEYELTNISVPNVQNIVSDAQSEWNWKLSGFKGWRQTRELKSGLSRSVMASLQFEFTAVSTSDFTFYPTQSPTPSPTDVPSADTTNPTMAPTLSPSLAPSLSPTAATKGITTLSPTAVPTTSPTDEPTAITSAPSESPSVFSTGIPTTASPTFPPNLEGSGQNITCVTVWGEGSVSCSESSGCALSEGNCTMTGCTGYSIDGQIVEMFIEDEYVDGDDLCLVSTLNGTFDDVVAIAICCHFETVPEINYKVYYMAAIFGGVAMVCVSR